MALSSPRPPDVGVELVLDRLLKPHGILGLRLHRRVCQATEFYRTQVCQPERRRSRLRSNVTLWSIASQDLAALAPALFLGGKQVDVGSN